MHRFLTLFSLLVFAADAAAQVAPRIAPGNRIRVHVEPVWIAGHEYAPRLEGTLEGELGDTIHVRIHNRVDPVAVPADWITRLEVSLGPASFWQGAVEGARMGLLLGAGIGAVVGAEVANTTDEDFFDAVLLRMAVYGASLGLTTAFARALRPGERWRSIPVEGLLGRASARGRAVVGLRLAWSPI